MAANQQQLARLRGFIDSVRTGDPLLAEEGRDLARTEMSELSGTDLDRAVEQESIALRRERPVLAIKQNVTQLVFIDEADSAIWGERIKRAKPVLDDAIRAVGRVDLNGGQLDWVGTGWLVAENVIVTNRHVAREFAERKGERFTFKMGLSDRISAGIDFLQEIDNQAKLVFQIVKPLHIEDAPGPDVAFFEVTMMSGSARLAKPIALAASIATTQNVATIGYPAYDSRIPEPQLMEQIYGKIYNKKRLAPGGVTRVEQTRIWHNCTTLGGNSGSVVLDLDKGDAVGLHFSGSFLATNYAVRADIVKRMLDDVRAGGTRRRTQSRERSAAVASVIPSRPRAARTIAGPANLTIPLMVNVSLAIDPDRALRPSRSRMPQASQHVQDDQIDENEAVAADYDNRGGYDATFLGDNATVELPTVTRNVDDTLEFESGDGIETELKYEHYSVIMSRSRRMCFLSACNIDGNLSKKSGRVAWKWDPRIPKARQIMQECYGSPPKFSRGHMTRREDPGWGPPAIAKRGNEDSMHVTNATPQMEAFNSPIWLALEDYALQHAREDAMKISVFTGPYFSDDDPEMYGVRIPLAFWKVIAFIHDETGKLCATGYEMNQEQSIQPEEEFVFGAFTSPQLGTAAQVSISSIEERSGIDFGRLVSVDPLANEEESVSGGGAPAPLTRLEQIRFVVADTDRPPVQSAARSDTRIAPVRRPVADAGVETMFDRLPAAAAVSGLGDVSSFSIEQLRKASFSWQTVFSLSLASKLAYENSSVVEDFTLREWGFQDYRSMDRGAATGFVALTNDVIVVAFRGSDQLTHWLDDLDVQTEQRSYGRINKSFYSAFRSIEADLRWALVNVDRGNLWLTGHGLGGALATIAAAELSSSRLAGLYTFGQPKVMDVAARNFLNQRYPNRLMRFVNNRDLVTRVPPGFEHVGRLIHFNAFGGLDDIGTEAIPHPADPPPYTQEQFDKLQSQIRKLKATSTRSEATEGSITSLSVEGLFPGLSDHHLDRYIAAIRDFTSNTVSDPSIAVELSAREASEGVETAGVSKATRRSSDMIPILIKVRHLGWTPPAGVKIGSRLGHVWSAQTPHNLVSTLETDPGVVSLELSREGGRQELVTSVPYIRGDVVHRPPLDERGDAALVGLIDTGIDILHDAFRSDDESRYRTRIVAIWNQQDETGPSPKDVDSTTFSLDYGTLYLKRDIQRLIDSPGPLPPALRDPKAHGTHVASIAAGRRCVTSSGVVTMSDGMAPEAGIVVVIPKLKAGPGDPWSVGYSNNHLEAVAFLQSVAKGRNKVLSSALPMAVNMSIGMNAGGHDGSSLLEAGIDSCTEKGRLPGFVIVKSAGNERGFGGHHRVQAYNGVTAISWVSDAVARPRDYFEVWYSVFDDLSFWLTDPANRSTPVVSAANPKQAAIIGENACALDLSLNNKDSGANRLVMTISAQGSDIQHGNWSLHVQGNRVRSTTPFLDIWVERDDSARAVRFIPETPEMTLSIPGTADTVICVAACRSNDPLFVIPQSSFGPTRTGSPKPDVSAPGEGIVAAQANTNDHQAVVAMIGTSMAAPHVTGAFALALSSRQKDGSKLQHNAVQLRSAVNTTAQHFGPHHAGTGYGLLDAKALFDYLTTI